MLPEIDEELIVKYLDGEASPDEAMAVDDWRNASSENKKVFEEIEQSMSLFNRQRFESPDRAQAWKELKEKTIDKGPAKTRVLFTPLRIAASVLLISLVSAAVYLSQKTNTNNDNLLVKESATEIVTTNLADQSKITQYRNTVISYPKTFKKEVREVNLVKGEAYFDVAHNPQQPFVVNVDEIHVKVLGTSFNIQNEKDSSSIEVQVTRGSVLIYNDFGSEVVKAGEIGTYDKETKRFAVTGNSASNLNKVSYATESFDFRDETLFEVTNHLSKTFGVKFKFKNENLKDCRMNGEFNARQLDFILKVISATFGIDYKQEGNTIELSGNACE